MLILFTKLHPVMLTFRNVALTAVILAMGLVWTGCNGDSPDTNDPETADTTANATAGEMQTDMADEGEFEHLFDGSNLDGWRGFQMDDVPEGWQINEEGNLVVAGDEPDRDLITRDTYQNFDLRLDFWVPEEGNSGIFYMVAENDYDEAWHSGPEYQILDEEGFGEDSRDYQLTATNYGLEARSVDNYEGTETWQTARIVKDGNRIQHWLNGELVVEYEVGSEEWDEQLQNSSFADFDSYARYNEGHIGLQHYGVPVRFRDIRIRTW